MKRVFSHNNDINFNDFLKNKKGKEIIKNMKSKNTNFTKFQNYDLFKIITKTYYKYQTNRSDIKIPINIDDSKTSFLIYNDIFLHTKHCHYCQYNKENFKNCKELIHILRGKYIESPISNNIFLHNRINIDDYCLSCPAINIDDSHAINIDDSSAINTSQIIKPNPKNNLCKCLGLCKETKPLFI